MKLWQTRRHWEKFARTDPLWAVLAQADKTGNRWGTDEFFESGRQEVASELKTLRRLCPELRLGHALDFGCGPGRLSQGLALHFDRVTGVDISTGMLALARHYNRHGERVNYVHNANPDLGCFATWTFDFVYSIITLQHVAPAYSRRYVAEFMRVLAPGGVALFQLPSHNYRPNRLSLWPPTVAKKLRRAWRRLLVIEACMEMNVVPRAEVLAILRAAGGEVVAVDRDHAAGDDFESYRYLVRRS